MQGTIQDYTLDMAADTKSDPLRVKQCDTNSRQAKITLKMSHEPWTIPFDAQIYLNVMKTDGNLATSTCTKVDEHTVLAPVTEQMTAISGTHMAELYFLGGDGDIKTQSFKLVVYPMVMDQDQIESSRDFQSLQDALRDVKASTETAGIAAQYATEQGNAARNAAQRAEDAADSLQVAVDAAKAAKTSETNAKASETAAAQTQQEVTDYVESQKAAFVGYSKRETDSQYANAIIKTATGAGRVDVDDAWTAPVIGLDVAGKSEQVVTTGKNLFGGDALVEVLKAEAGATVDGVNGTVTYISSAINNKIIYSGFEAGKEYTIILFGKNTKISHCNLRVEYSNGTKEDLRFDVFATDSYCVYHTASGRDVVNIVGVWADANTVLYYDKCGIFEGNIDLSAFEPYTGAAASPSPAYPQQIVSTGTVGTGAQLLPPPKVSSGTVAGITYRMQEGYMILNGTSAGSDVTMRDIYFCGIVNQYADAGFPVGDITLSVQGLPAGINILVVKADGQIVASVNNEIHQRTFAHTEGDTYRIMCRIWGVNTVYSNGAIKPMLNAGPYAKPWEPYTGGKPAPSAEYPQEMTVRAAGKNLLEDKLYLAAYDVGVAFVTFDTAKLPYNPESENSGIARIARCKKGETYVFSVTNPNSNYSIRIAEYENIEASKNTKNNLGITTGSKNNSITYTAKSDGILVCLIAGVWTDGHTMTHKCTESELLQCEVGSTATPYEPYHTAAATITLTEPLRGIGEYRDRLGYRDGVWGIEGRCAENVFDGSPDEAWGFVSAWNNACFSKLLPDAIIVNNYITIVDMLCDKLNVKTPDKLASELGATGIGIGAKGASTLYVAMPEAVERGNATAFREYLAANPLTVVYPLATPTWTPLPDSAQQALNALTTFSGTTHLTITTGGTTPDVTLDYVQDTHKALEEHDAAAKEYTDNQLANIVAAMPVEVQAAIVDTQITTLLKEV